MRKLLKVIALVVLAAVVLAIGVGFALPSEYLVERSIVVNADRERIHALVGDLNRWPEWAPWQEADTTIRITYGDTTRGVGAHQSWRGDSGSGELTVTSSSPESGIEYDLSFDGGAWLSVAALKYQPEGDATRVTWSMWGDAGGNLIGRYFGVMMDYMVGPMFEGGLDKLKARAERGS